MTLDIEHYSKYSPLSNLDNNENIFFKEELQSIIPDLIDIAYAPFSARNLFPMDTSIDPGAEVITYTQYDGTGVAEIIASYTTDIPLVNVKGTQFSSQVVSFAIAYKVAMQELRAASYAKKPLDMMLVRRARDAMYRKENKLVFFGDDNHNIKGLFNNPNIPVAAVPVGGGGFTEWSTKTAAEILADMHLIANGPAKNTFNIESAKRLLIPHEQYDLISNTNAGLGDSKSILETYIAMNRYAKDVVAVQEMDEAIGGEDVIVAYDPNPDKLKMIVPLDLLQHPPERTKLFFETIYEMRTGGLLVKFPFSVNIGTGI